MNCLFALILFVNASNTNVAIIAGTGGGLFLNAGQQVLLSAPGNSFVTNTYKYSIGVSLPVSFSVADNNIYSWYGNVPNVLYGGAFPYFESTNGLPVVIQSTKLQGQFLLMGINYGWPVAAFWLLIVVIIRATRTGARNPYTGE